jgi:putative Ca2+/H+ antiporter (TMEM165/GDT1 family)
MLAFVSSLMFVALAEMGDKTQLLAMTFAAKYRTDQVLAGVFGAILLNQAVAVAAGWLLSSVVPLGIISFIAALSFIGFGLWNLAADDDDDGAEKQYRFGPVLTVAAAFFIAEMGDKTQLATVSLTVQYGKPVAVLLGTTAGMMLANCLGIFVGAAVCRNIPARLMAWAAALVFIAFGLSGVYQSLRSVLPAPQVIPLMGGILCAIAAAAWFIVRRKQRAVEPVR